MKENKMIVRVIDDDGCICSNHSESHVLAANAGAAVSRAGVCAVLLGAVNCGHNPQPRYHHHRTAGPRLLRHPPLPLQTTGTAC